MNKRGQLIFAFIIIGMSVIAAFAFLYYISYVQSGKSFKPGIISQLSLNSESASFKGYVQSCLEETTREGLDYFGVKESSAPLIEQYIKAELPKCIDFQAFEEFGIEITPEQVKPSVLITDKSVLVDVYYPITLEKQGATSTLENFNYYLKREKSTEFTFDANQRTTEEQRIVTEDGDAELIIPVGTKVYDKNGNLVDEVTLKVLDRNFDGLSNNVVIGMVVYDGIPDGARFSPPITLKLYYGDMEIPPGVREEDLKIGWYDKERGFWWGIPSSRVDTINKIITAEMSHFTNVGIVGCTRYLEEETITSEEIKSIEFEYKPLYEQTCGKSYESGDCLEPTEWDSVGEITGWHENQDATTTPLLQSGYNEPLTTMYGYYDCSDEPVDWDKDDKIDNDCKNCHEDCVEMADAKEPISGDGIRDDSCQCEYDANDNIIGCKRAKAATPMTYGYPTMTTQTAANGYGIVTFQIAENGAGCVMEKVDLEGAPTLEADITIEIVCSEGDNCGDQDEIENSEDGYVDITNNVPFNPNVEWGELHPGEGIPYIDEDQGLQAGVNNAYIKIENENGDGCVWAEARITIVGTGITFMTNWDDCGVQDAINTLCGKGDPSYNDNYPNCEYKADGETAIGFESEDRGPLMWDIINGARAVDTDNWRDLSLSQLANYDSITAVMQGLGVTCSQGSWQPTLSCSAQGGQIVGTAQECGDMEGWIVPQTGSWKFCCVTQGCCCSEPLSAATPFDEQDCGDASEGECDGHFYKKSCNQIKSEEGERAECTTSEGAIIPHGEPFIDQGACAVCENGKHTPVDLEWCSGVSGCCKSDSECVEGIKYSDCEGELHTRKKCSEVEGCPQYTTTDIQCCVFSNNCYGGKTSEECSSEGGTPNTENCKAIEGCPQYKFGCCEINGPWTDAGCYDYRDTEGCPHGVLHRGELCEDVPRCS